MSDYERIKVVRYPITKEEIVAAWNFNEEQADGINWSLEKWNRDLFDYGVINKFTVTGVDDGLFLDYVLDHEYGVDGEWNKIRELKETEIAKYTKIFKQLPIILDSRKLRLVEYCWYNGCEPPAYYDIKNDPFYDEV